MRHWLNDRFAAECDAIGAALALPSPGKKGFMREHLRAVIWPRQNAKSPTETVDREGKKVYRYSIVGILVTDRELTFTDPNEVLVDGPVSLGLQLESAPQRQCAYPPGDASDVLVSLGTL